MCERAREGEREAKLHDLIDRLYFDLLLLLVIAFGVLVLDC